MLHPPNVLKKYLPPEAMLGELVGWKVEEGNVHTNKVIHT
jgi:hypothetical protein